MTMKTGIISGIAAVIVIIAATAGASMYSAKATREGLDDISTLINSYPGNKASVEILEEGPFLTRAHMNIGFDSSFLEDGLDPVQQQQAAMDAELQRMMAIIEEGLSLDITIHRGPLVMHEGLYAGLYKADIRLDTEDSSLHAMLEEALGREIDLNDYFTATAHMNYAGNGEFRLDVIDYPETVIDDARISWGGAELVYRFRDYGEAYETDGVIEALAISQVDGEGRIHIERSTVTGHGRIPEPGQWITEGEFDFTTSGMTFDVPEDDINVVIRDPAFGVTIRTHDDNRFDFSYRLGVGEVAANVLDSDIGHFRLDLGFDNMDITAFNNFYTAISDPAIASDPMRMRTVMMQSFTSLLSGNPTFNIYELSFAQGDDMAIDLDASLNLGEGFLTNMTMAMMNPAAMLNGLGFALNAEFSPSILELVLDGWIARQMGDLDLDDASLAQLREEQRRQVNGMVMQFVQMGYLVESNDRYRLQARMMDGQLMVNDMPVPLPMF